MPPDSRVLVVGTTPDYIDWIRCACPRRCVFITEPDVRRNAREPAPDPDEEILCSLTDTAQVRQAAASHQQKWGLTIDGIACFDCESLALAAILAKDMSLNFPSPSAVDNCRNKLLAKTIWQQNGISAPRTAPVKQVEDAVAFFREIGNGCVLKPVSGSGSELVFCCRSEEECRRSFAVLKDGLSRRVDNRLYRDIAAHSDVMIAEEFVKAAEFSCDFLLENGRAVLIRLSKKIPAAAETAFGTTMGYVLIDSLPGVGLYTLTHDLARGATALGLDRSVCMADFMVREGKIILLEITPRPGGDCLPALIRYALGVDMLVLTLDLAQNRPLGLNALPPPKLLTGLRLHAGQAGVLKKINWEVIADDPRVKEFFPLRQSGDRIRMPPEDYETFLLGNIIFAPNDKTNAVDECRRLLSALIVEMEP